MLDAAVVGESPETADVHDSGVHSLFDRYGLTSIDVVIIAIAALCCIAFAPFFVAPRWTPRAVLAVGVVPVGVVSLSVRLVRREWAAILGVGALLWATLSALLSSEPALSMKGAIGRESTVIFLLAAIGLWSLGALTDNGRAAMAKVLIGAFALNALVGIGQVIAHPETGSLALEAGRAYGLTTHPVYFGALMAGGCALTSWSWSARRPYVSLVLLALFGVGASISGARIAVLSAIVFTAYAGVLAGWRRVASSCAAMGFGVFLGLVMVGQFAEDSTAGAVAGATAGTGRESAVDRLSSSGSSLSARLDLWKYGLGSVLDHPLFGSGIGNFRSAVQGRYTAQFTLLNARDDTAPWFDAHNVFVEYAVAVGIVGLALLVAFASTASWRARGPLAAAAAAIALTWLLEPASLTTLPLVMLLVGASSSAAPVFSAGLMRTRRIGACAAGLGLLCSTLFVVADLRLKAATESGDPQRIESAIKPYWHDPVASDLAAQAWRIDSLENPAAEENVLEWSRRTVDYEHTRPGWWEKLAVQQNFFGHNEDARSSLERAIELQPWRISSWLGMRFIADITNDKQLEDQARAALCELQMPQCTEDP